MSKYKPLDAPITRREACTILDRKRFDGAVRSCDIVPLGKMSGNEVVAEHEGPRTAPLVFNQQAVRDLAKAVAQELAVEAADYRTEAKAVAKLRPPLTRRQIAKHLGKKQTGVLIRSGALQPYGTLTDTQTAAHTYDPAEVAKVINDLADLNYAESKLLSTASKARIPA
jgi:hypothetical protein